MRGPAVLIAESFSARRSNRGSLVRVDKPRVSVLSLFVVLACATSSPERSEFEAISAQLDRTVAEAIEAWNTDGLVMEVVGDALFGRLGQGETQESRVEIRAGERVAISGVCSDACRDLDLFLFTEAGEHLAADERADSQPFLVVEVDRDGSYLLIVQMVRCLLEECEYGVQVFGILSEPRTQPTQRR